MGVSVLFTITGRFRYEVLRLISEGGMGEVYQAAQLGAEGFRKQVAIKIIRKEFARQKRFIEKFLGEAKLVADLIHTNIVQTYHLGETSGRFYITMEYINGVDLGHLMAQLASKGQRLPVELAVFIASRVARGLAYAHAKTDEDGNPLGIVHHDVHPRNIMIAFEGDVKLTDFGIAKARGYLESRAGDPIMGTPEFLSPEQAAFQQTDHRSDLFSTGLVLAYMLLGYNPFRADDPEETRQRILTMPIPDFHKLDPRITPELNRILQKTLERDPDQRFQTADELRDALEYYIYHKGLGPTNETLGRYVRKLFGQVTRARILQSRGQTQRIDSISPSPKA